MTEVRYKIIFDGQLMPDMALETVKENLARLFKSEQSRIDALFSGSAVALKRDLAEAEADKYLAALQKAGARVRKESEGPQLSLVATADHDQIAEPDAATASMDCPKCGHSQPQSSECSACGIVIEKYLARQAQLAASAPAAEAQAPASAPASPYSTPKAEVGEALPEHGPLNIFSVRGRIGRLRYLGWSMGMMLLFTLAYAIAAGIMAVVPIVGGLLMIPVVIGSIVVAVMIGVQRLHDIGWSGWLWLINLVPLVGFVFSLLMLVVPGTSDANRYGPPPPPNSRGVIAMAWGGLLLSIIATVGILAAVAIPAYQEYVQRAQDAQQFQMPQTEE